MIQRAIRLVVDQVAVGNILDRVAQNKEPNQIGLSGEMRREKKIRALDPKNPLAARRMERASLRVAK